MLRFVNGLYPPDGKKDLLNLRPLTRRDRLQEQVGPVSKTNREWINEDILDLF
jgi:hypothetical protein